MQLVFDEQTLRQLVRPIVAEIIAGMVEAEQRGRPDTERRVQPAQQGVALQATSRWRPSKQPSNRPSSSASPIASSTSVSWDRAIADLEEAIRRDPKLKDPLTPSLVAARKGREEARAKQM